jgi:hypothetical protein
MGAVAFAHPLEWRGMNARNKTNGGRAMLYFQTSDANDHLNPVALSGPRKLLQKQRAPRRKCRVETAAIWRKVAHLAAVEPVYQPSAEKVRAVKSSFATARAVLKPRETASQAHLLYDTFSQPAPPGTRSSAMNVRQMLYRADPHQIDIHLELQPEQNRFVVTGQLVDLSHPDLVGRDVQITLSDGRESVVNTVTNQFGEFRGEVENSGDLEISFVGRTGKPIVILLRGALAPFPPAKE